MFFPSGYLPKLMADMLQKQKLKPDLHIFQDGVVFSMTTSVGGVEYKLEVRLELRSLDKFIQVEIRAESTRSFKSSRSTPAFMKMTEICDLIMGRDDNNDNSNSDGVEADLNEVQDGGLNWRLNLELEEFGVDPRLDKNREEKMTDLIDTLTSGSMETGEAALFVYGSDEDDCVFDEQVYRPQVTIPSLLPRSDGRHVMISYCWNPDQNKQLVTQLDNRLRALGIDTWRDEVGSSVLGPLESLRSVFEGMAAAIEASSHAIIFVSREYQTSQNCKSELEYLYQRRSTIKLLFVMLDSNFTLPDGALGLALAGSIYYELFDESSLDDVANKLVEAIRS
jgi:hypothetical protein